METIGWKDAYSFWKMKVSLIAPELLESVSFKHIKFKYNDAMHRIYGYDWLHKDEYESRLKRVTEKPFEFLYFGESLNKGTLQTAQYLAEAKDDSEILAVVWIYSFVQDLLNDLPESLRGNRYRCLSGIQFGIYPKLNEKIGIGAGNYLSLYCH